MEQRKKEWNQNQKALREALKKPTDIDQILELFLNQHAAVHSAKMSNANIYSFEDEITSGLTEAQLRKIPQRFNHSIAWNLWHLARVEDVTMNLLVAGKKQVVLKNNWLDKLNYRECHTGNGMSDKSIMDFSEAVNIKALLKYRIEVGRNTGKNAAKLTLDCLTAKVEQSRIQKIWDDKSMLRNAKEIIDYWSRQTIAGLMLMPFTRHCFLHLNESRRIRDRVIKETSI